MSRLNDPMGFISLATELPNLVSSQDLKFSRERTIISRLYYGIFNFLKLKLYPANDPNISHDKLRAKAQEYAKKKGFKMDLIDPLKQLQAYREHADYYRTKTVDEDLVKKAYTIYGLLEGYINTVWNEQV